MGFSRDANFIITIDQSPFNSQFDEFNQILKDLVIMLKYFNSL